RSGGISAAAREIHTVQSNVTMRIKALEDEIGLALFERHSRGMALTEAGQRLLPYAERVLSLLREAKVAARDHAAEQGVLQLGSVAAGVGITLLPKAVFMQSAQRDALRWHLIDGEEGAVTTLFIRRRDAYESRALQRFLGLMRPDAAALPGSAPAHPELV